MTNEEIILDVIKRVKKRPFGFMTEEDIAQEAWIIINNIMPKWDGVRSLENFLMSSVVRRLKSFSRTFYRSKERMDSINFVQLEDRPIEYEDVIVNADLVEHISTNLPVSMRADFLRLSNGVSIPATRKAALISKVKEIVYGET